MDQANGNPLETYRQAQKVILQHYGLTRSETTVAFRILSGEQNSEAAEALFVTESAIKFHLTHIYKKVGVRSRKEFKHAIRSLTLDLLSGGKIQ